MDNKLVHLRFPNDLYSDSQRIVKEKGFISIQEFIRHSVRKTIDDFKLQASIRRLEKFKGSVKGIRRLTQAEKEGVFNEVAAMSQEEQSELFRKAGLDKMRKLEEM